MVEKNVSLPDMEKTSILSNNDQDIFSRFGDDDKPRIPNIMLLRYPPMNIPDNKGMIEVDMKEKTGNLLIAKQ